MSIKNLKDSINKDYAHGFITDIATDDIPLGINPETIRLIWKKKQEPDFMLDYRLKAYDCWCKMTEPNWANINYKTIKYNDIIYYSAPVNTSKSSKIKNTKIDDNLLETYNKLGIPLQENAKFSGIAVDAIFDSISVITTFKDKLKSIGVIFCSFSEALHKYPELIKKYLNTVVPYNDNYFAALNSAVFSDGSFVYIPRGVHCPMELSSYFRINAANTGQFERTLIIAEADSYVSYLEGCSAPVRDNNQLHAAVVELIAHDNATIKYSTVQNWYPGDKNGNGGIYNFVTKRGECRGYNSKISWTQIETGSAITWKYPSTILVGDNSSSEFYSVAVTTNHQQTDTGTKMIHLGKNTTSTIISKSISSGFAQNSYRSLVKISQSADYARNYTQCDSLLLSNTCGAHAYPKVTVSNNTAIAEHEASVTNISDEQLFYCQQRNISKEDAITLIVNGFCKQVFQKLPMEFAVEAYKLINLILNGVTNVKNQGITCQY